MKGNLWTVIALALALAVLVPVVNIGFANAAQNGVANESTAIDFSQNYTLEESPDDVFEYGNFTVIDEGSGNELVRGSDYLIDETAGELDWQDTVNTTDGNQSSVNYTYEFHDGTTDAQNRVLTTAGVWVGYILIAAALGYLVILTGGGSF